MSEPSPIAAIERRLCDVPDDVEAWRIYGDWLNAQGDARGEIVALDLDAHVAGRLLEHDLISQALTALREAATTPIEWQHGFLRAAAIHIDDAIDVAGLTALFAGPYTRLLRSIELTIGPEIPLRDLAPLGQLPLACLRELRIVEQPRGDVGLRALVGACTRLAALDCRGAGLGDDGAVALAELAAAGTLRHVHLQRNGLTDEGLERLAPRLVDVELLDLRDNPIGERGLVVLAEAPALGRLRTLGLQLDTFRTGALRVLADSTTLPRAIVRYVQGVIEQRKDGW